MKRIRPALLAIAVLVLATQYCTAAPIVTSTVSDLGGGLHAFDVYLVDPGSDAKSWFVTDFEFTGAIQQILAFGSVTVSKESDANTFNGLGGYVKLTDTWAGAAWVDFPPPAIVDTPGVFSITGGTGGGSAYTTVLLAHIVASGQIDYSGRISRYTVPNGLSVEGTLAVPEPATVALLAIGLLACGGRLWRRSRLDC